MKAQTIVRIAMGKDRYGNWNYDLDPLAAWCGVEAIIGLAQRKTSHD